MTLALIGLITSVLVVGANALFAEDAATPEDVFWQAVNAARKQALLSGRDVRLTYVPAERETPAALAIQGVGVADTFPFSGKSDVKIDFLSLAKARSAILVGGQMLETNTMPAVTFFGDGTCMPFRAQIRVGTNPARTLMIDPWTCAAVLPKEEQRL